MPDQEQDQEHQPSLRYGSAGEREVELPSPLAAFAKA
jgi:hypothetical protein